MSRSYRKPILTQGYGGKRRKHAKRQANKAARLAKDLASGKSGYKKGYSNWDIVDWKFPDKTGKAKRK